MRSLWKVLKIEQNSKRVESFMGSYQTQILNALVHFKTSTFLKIRPSTFWKWLPVILVLLAYIKLLNHTLFAQEVLWIFSPC